MEHYYSSLPSQPGVYLFQGKNKEILYVGKAKNLKKRVSSYFQKETQDSKTSKLLGEVVGIDHIVVNSEIEAYLLEASLIKKHKPFYNIKLADDKIYPYLIIVHDVIPYVAITRKKNIPRAEYYGPYPNVSSLKVVLKIVRKLFPFQSVKNHPKRVCLFHHLALCPCIPVFPENLPEYKRNLQKLENFLNGKTAVVIHSLKADQNEYIKSEEFEKASLIQKKIERIELITSETYDPFHYEERPNFYFERIANELRSLSDILRSQGMEINELHRIECYDISNFGGLQATGSMVVFVNGDASKKDYRKFKIMRKNTPDDFAMHQEMMERRLKHLDDWGKPDLLVIDGGKGQVSSVLEILVRYGIKIPLIGLAKREEIIVVPIKPPFGRLEFVEVKLPHSTPGINLLRRLRDESHRFAITYHRLLRKKKTFI